MCSFFLSFKDEKHSSHVTRINKCSPDPPEYEKSKLTSNMSKLLKDVLSEDWEGQQVSTVLKSSVETRGKS